MQKESVVAHSPRRAIQGEIQLCTAIIQLHVMVVKDIVQYLCANLETCDNTTKRMKVKAHSDNRVLRGDGEDHNAVSSCRHRYITTT